VTLIRILEHFPTFRLPQTEVGGKMDKNNDGFYHQFQKSKLTVEFPA
jgi:hypothetical protein